MKQVFFHSPQQFSGCRPLCDISQSSELAESLSSFVRRGYQASQGGCGIPGATQIGCRGQPLALLLVTASSSIVTAFGRRGGQAAGAAGQLRSQPAAVS